MTHKKELEWSNAGKYQKLPSVHSRHHEISFHFQGHLYGIVGIYDATRY